MDVDTHPGSLPTSSSASSELDIDGVDLGSLNNNMTKMFKSYWQLEALTNRADENAWRGVNVLFFQAITEELAATELKSKIIGIPQYKAAQSIVKGLNPKELEQWEAGVLSGVRTGDWQELIKHRT
jgi:hypothetical protein